MKMKELIVIVRMCSGNLPPSLPSCVKKKYMKELMVIVRMCSGNLPISHMQSHLHPSLPSHVKKKKGIIRKCGRICLHFCLYI